MYHSIYFADYKMTANTFETWYLAPMDRPSFNPPEYKRSMIEIPGRNGLLDISTTLTKIPNFGNRTGELKFLILPDSKYSWYETYSMVMNYLHGQEKDAWLEDDPAYLYHGRFWINDFKSDEKYSTITISYSVEPYKKSRWTTLEDWDVDPFNLEQNRKVSDWFKNLIVDAEPTIPNPLLIETFDTISQFTDDNRQQIVGQGVVIPTLYVQSTDGNGFDVIYRNEELEINETIHLNDGSNRDDRIKLSMHHPNNWIRLSAIGHGLLSIEYNVRSL